MPTWEIRQKVRADGWWLGDTWCRLDQHTRHTLSTRGFLLQDGVAAAAPAAAFGHSALPLDKGEMIRCTISIYHGSREVVETKSSPTLVVQVPHRNTTQTLRVYWLEQARFSGENTTRKHPRPPHPPRTTPPRQSTVPPSSRSWTPRV